MQLQILRLVLTIINSRCRDQSTTTAGAPSVHSYSTAHCTSGKLCTRILTLCSHFHCFYTCSFTWNFPELLLIQGIGGYVSTRGSRDDETGVGHLVTPDTRSPRLLCSMGALVAPGTARGGAPTPHLRHLVCQCR